jgi:hypothetical protein
VFLGNSTLLTLTVPETEDVPATRQLLRPQRGMRRFAWPDGTSIEFHISPGDWIRLSRRSGFEIEDLVEIAFFGGREVGAEDSESVHPTTVAQVELDVNQQT